jgi:lambda repressor-like predicted transcriptional regulator
MVAVARAYAAGASMKELARWFRVHRTTIAGCLRQLGIPIRQPGLQQPDIEGGLYEQGWSLTRLGEHFGRDAGTVRKELRAAGVKMRKRWERA